VKLPDLIYRTDLYRTPALGAALLILLELVLTNTWLLRWP
jgi:hypothetical protein